MELNELQASDFECCIDQKFLIRFEDGETLETELVEVQGLVPADDDPDRRPPFSLIFRGPADAVLVQHLYQVENETLGKLAIFLVTIGPGKDGRLHHETIFT